MAALLSHWSHSCKGPPGWGSLQCQASWTGWGPLSTTIIHLLPTDAEATTGQWLHWKFCSVAWDMLVCTILCPGQRTGTRGWVFPHLTDFLSCVILGILSKIERNEQWGFYARLSSRDGGNHGESPANRSRLWAWGIPPRWIFPQGRAMPRLWSKELLNALTPLSLLEKCKNFRAALSELCSRHHAVVAPQEVRGPIPRSSHVSGGTDRANHQSWLERSRVVTGIRGQVTSYPISAWCVPLQCQVLL